MRGPLRPGSHRMWGAERDEMLKGISSAQRVVQVEWR